LKADFAIISVALERTTRGSEHHCRSSYQGAGKQKAESSLPALHLLSYAQRLLNVSPPFQVETLRERLAFQSRHVPASLAAIVDIDVIKLDPVDLQRDIW